MYLNLIKLIKFHFSKNVKKITHTQLLTTECSTLKCIIQHYKIFKTKIVTSLETCKLQKQRIYHLNRDFSITSISLIYW